MALWKLSLRIVTLRESNFFAALMQTTTSPSRRRRWLIALLLMASLLVVVAKKFFDYSAAPAKDKESDFVYPPNANQTKPTTLVLQVPPAAQVPFEQVGGYINDASNLNKTAVYGIVKVTTVQDIQSALQFARDHKLKVTAAGGSRHSMGGHTIYPGGTDPRAAPGIVDLRARKKRPHA